MTVHSITTTESSEVIRKTKTQSGCGTLGAKACYSAGLCLHAAHSCTSEFRSSCQVFKLRVLHAYRMAPDKNLFFQLKENAGLKGGNRDGHLEDSTRFYVLEM